MLQRSLGAALVAVLLPCAALAETIEEIVVSVQKREQSQQDVPIAISAYGGDFLRALNAQDFRDVIALTPGFNGNTADSFNDALGVRGISSNSFGVGGDGSVPIFVDGFYEGRNGGLITSALDIDRIEVVRGPQNTLFGRNAVAGAVAITHNRPDPEAVSGEVGFGVAEFGHVDVKGTLNLPLNDRWALRGSVGYLEEDGYLTNLAGGPDLGKQENSAIQAALGYSGDVLTANFSALFERRDSNGSAYWSTAPLNASGELDFADQTSPLPEDAVVNDLVGQDEADILRFILDLDVDLGGGYGLKSITGFKTYDFQYAEDYDATAALVDHFTVDQDVDYFSQELRLLSPDDGRLSWFVGASVYSEKVKANFADRYTEDDLCRALQITEDDDFDQSARVTGCDDPIFEEYWEDDIDPDDLLENKPEQTLIETENFGAALYADISWAVTDRLDLNLGARYTYDEKEYSTCVPDSGGALGNNFIYDFFYTAETVGDCGRSFAGTASGGTVSDTDDWQGFTPRLALNFAATDNLNLYGNVAWGFKSGGFGDFGFIAADGSDAESDEDTGLALPGTRPDKFDEETVLSFELGAKSLLLNDSLQANLAIYGYDYSDLQVTFFSGGAQRTGTVDAATGYGAEADLRWLPGENWDIYFSIAYSQTEIDKVSQRLIDQGLCDNCVGNELAFAPRWTTGTVVRYTFPLANSAGLFVTGEHSFYDKAFGGLDNIELAATDSWNEVNFRVGYDSGSNWVLTAYVLNAFSEEYFERGWENADADNLFGYGNVNSKVWPSRPRSFGARIDYRFGAGR